MNQNEKQRIVELLCSSQPESIALAEAICDSQNFPLETILREFGYWEVGIRWAADFTNDTLDCSFLELEKLPDLLPAALSYLDCDGNLLTKLPLLPANLKALYFSNNQFTILPDLPLNLEALYFDYNKIKKIPHLPNSLTELGFSDNLVDEICDFPPTLILLNCANNQLVELLKLPPTLRSFRCKGNVFNIPPDKIKALVHKNCYISCDTLEEIAAKKLIWTEAENISLLTLRDKRGLSYNEMQPYFIDRTVEQIVLQYRKLKQ